MLFIPLYVLVGVGVVRSFFMLCVLSQKFYLDLLRIHATSFSLFFCDIQWD